MTKITYTAINKATNIRRLIKLNITEAIVYGHNFQTEDEEFYIYQCDIEKLNILLN